MYIRPAFRTSAVSTADSPVHVLVTGGTGFVGGHLINEIREDFRVTCVSRTKQSRTVPTVNVDISEADCIEELPADVDVVVHLAAYVPDNQEGNELRQCNSVNGGGTLHLLEYARRQDVQRFIYVSSCHYFDSKVEDGHVTYTLDPPNVYEASKYAGEVFGGVYRDAHDLELTTLRASYIYGPGMPENTVVFQFVERAMNGEKLILYNGGADTTDFVYVGDIVRAIRSAIEGPRGEFVVGSGTRSSIRDLAEAVRAVAGDDVDIVSEPASGEPTDHFVHEREGGEDLDFEPDYSLETGIEEMISHVGGWSE